MVKLGMMVERTVKCSRISKAERKTQRIVRLAATVSWIVLSLPFHWNSKDEKFVVISPLRLRLYYLVCILDFVNRTSRSIGFVWCLYTNVLSINQIVWGAIMLVTFVLTYTIQVNMMFKHEEYRQWINIYIHLGTKLERKFKVY